MARERSVRAPGSHGAPRGSPRSPPRVTNPLPPRCRRLPGSTQPIPRVTPRAVAGPAAPPQGEVVPQCSASTPAAHAQRNPTYPVRPHQQDQREAIHRLALLVRKEPCQALHGGRTGLWSGTLFYLTASSSPLQLVNRSPPNPDLPTQPAPFDFCYWVPADDFAAVNVHYQCDALFRLIQGMGFAIGDCFDGTVFSGQLDYPATIGLPRTVPTGTVSMLQHLVTL
jgi:hypothetical protein